MRKVFGSHREVAHVWAQQSQSMGDASRKNPMDAKRRHVVRVTYSNGEQITTDINGTTDEVVQYYIGRSTVLRECEETGAETVAHGESIQFYDGEMWQRHHRTYKLLAKGAGWYVVDHGDQIGVEVFSGEHNGSKYFTDAAREQLLQNLQARNWPAFILAKF